MKKKRIVFVAVFVLLILTASCCAAEKHAQAESETPAYRASTPESETTPMTSAPETEGASIPETEGASIPETESFSVPETEGPSAPETEGPSVPETAETEVESAPMISEPETTGREEPVPDPDFSLYRAEISVQDDRDFAYSRDREGNLYGAADFWIDGAYAYILSTSSNTITVFQNQEVIRKIAFENGENGGMNLLQFAVQGDVAYAFAVNSQDSYLVKYVNWEPVARMSIYEFTSTDGFSDFYIKDGDLYVVALSDRTFNNITCLIHEEDGKLVCFEKRSGKLVDGSYFENNGKVRAALETVTATVAERDHFTFVAQVGAADCGADGSGGHYYQSVEVVSDETQEYLIQRIYHFDAEGGLLETAHIPGEVHMNILQPVKIFFGTPWTLYLSEESVALLPLAEAAEAHELRDSMLEIDW